MQKNVHKEFKLVFISRRHFENLQIYSYIGEILLAINPYKEMGLFSHRMMFRYKVDFGMEWNFVYGCY